MHYVVKYAVLGLESLSGGSESERVTHYTTAPKSINIEHTHVYTKMMNTPT